MYIGRFLSLHFLTKSWLFDLILAEARGAKLPGLILHTFTLPSARAKPEPVITGRRPVIEYLCILRFKNILIN